MADDRARSSRAAAAARGSEVTEVTARRRSPPGRDQPSQRCGRRKQWDQDGDGPAALSYLKDLAAGDAAKVDTKALS